MTAPDLGLGSHGWALINTDASARSTHIALPVRGLPRFLIPHSPNRVAAVALRQHSQSPSRGVRIALRLGSGLARLGLLKAVGGDIALGGDGTFLAHLEQVLGTELIASIHLGPARANRKPVLHLMERKSAQTLAYAKLGINGLTCRRVSAEAEALRLLEAAETGCLRTPRLVDSGAWCGLDYLVMQPFVTAPASGVSTPLRNNAGNALVAAFPSVRSTIAESAWWGRALASLDECDDKDPNVRRLRRSADRLLEQHGQTPMVLGAAHGDWSRWNMSAQGDDLAVWDWERFSTDTPIGWDEMHYRLGAHRRGPAAAVATPRSVLLDQMSPECTPLEGEALLSSYLFNRGVTTLADRQYEAGARSGDISTWLLPALELLLDSETAS